MPAVTSPNARSARKATPDKPTRKSRSNAASMIDPERRRALIAEAAYYRAERRGFAPGHEAEDWLAAEVEVDTALTVGVSAQSKPAMQ